MLTRIARVVTVPLLALTLASCGGGENNGSEVVTADDPSAAVSPGEAEESLDSVEQSRRYVECMREQGIDMPDPGPNGEIMQTHGPGFDQEAYEEAQEICHELAPEGGRYYRDPEHDERQREYAQCMREHGVDMQDPEPGGPIVVSQGPDTDPGEIEEAQEACQHILEGGA